jgi:16S rRNA processing protein RimM
MEQGLTRRSARFLFAIRDACSMKRTAHLDPIGDEVMTKLENPVLLATIGAAQGLRGEVRVRSYTSDPTSIGDYGHLHSLDGRSFEVLEVRQQKNVVIVRFRGVNDRTAAEALNGLELYVERENLPDEELDDDEFFYADLEGLEAVDDKGVGYGVVSGIYDFGAGDLLELKGPNRRPVLIPFNETAVLEIDLENGKIIVDPLAAGLIDNPDDLPGQPAKPGKTKK